jgi:opacity protein-like surface antigen
MKNIIFLISFLILTTASLFSQVNSNDKQFKWNIEFTGGQLIGGPNQDLKTAVIEEGYTSDLVLNNKLSWSVDANRRIISNLRFDLVMSTSQCNMNFKIGNAEWLISKFRITTISPLLIYNFRDFIFIGGGPGIYLIRYLWYDYMGQDGNYHKLGLLLKSTLEFPRKTRFFAKVDFQYRYIGSINNVPFSWQGRHGEIYYQSDKIGMNNIYFGFGIGIRFFYLKNYQENVQLARLVLR